MTYQELSNQRRRIIRLATAQTDTLLQLEFNKPGHEEFLTVRVKTPNSADPEKDKYSYTHVWTCNIADMTAGQVIQRIILMLADQLAGARQDFNILRKDRK